MSRVVIDATCLGRRKTGNETYMRGLLRGLSRTADTAGMEVVALVTPEHRGERQASIRWHEIGRGNFLTRNLVGVPRSLTKLHGDLYHAIYWVSPAVRTPLAVMVHDVSFVRHPEWFRTGEAHVYTTLIRSAVRRARVVLTVSEFSKAEICDVYGVPASRVVVTPNAAEALPEGPPPRVRESSEPYFLAVGNLHPRKNLIRLIEAFAELAQREPAARLVVVGQAAWRYHEIFAAARRKEVESRLELTGYVDRERLLALYRNATALVYPSLYEGFGLPLLEAMQAGCPVIASSIPAFREVAGEAALFVDPLDATDIADAMARVLGSAELQAGLSARGRENVRRFSWEDTARRTLAAYRLALDAG